MNTFDERSFQRWKLTETPRQIKVGAVMDAGFQAVRNAKVKCQETGEYQKVSFRSRKRKQTLYLRADSLKKNGFYVRLLGDMKMSEPLPANPQGKGKVSQRDTVVSIDFYRNTQVQRNRVRQMKMVIANLMLACASLIVLSLIFASIGTAEFDPKTVVGIWLFDEGKGNTAADSSENGNDGKLENNPKWIKNGKFGAALEFDGNESKGHVTVGNLGLSGAVTVVLWAKPSDAANDDRLISNLSGPTNPAFAIRFQNGAVDIWGRAWKPVIPKFDDNKWGHYAFVLDGEGNATGYYNGKEGETVADTYIFTDIGIGATFLHQWGQYYSGVFDEVAFFSVALTEDDIQTLMTRGLKSALAVYPAAKLTTTWGNLKVTHKD